MYNNIKEFVYKYRKQISIGMFFLLIGLTIVASMETTALADVGNSFSGGGSSSRSSGGSSSFSGGSSYSGGSSSSSSGGGSDFFLIYILIQLLNAIPFPFNVLIIIGLFALVYRSNNKKTTTITPIYTVNNFNVESEESVANKIKKNDSNFSKNEFKTYVREVYIKVQEAWEDRQFDTIRPFESNELYAIHSKQLNEYIVKDLKPHLDQQEILSTTLAKYEIDGKYEYVTVKLEANLIDFTTNSSGKIVEGNDKKSVYRIYKLLFKRVVGVKTKVEDGALNTTNCPNCGAPTQVTSSGTCEFCGSVITTGEYGWVLDEYSAWR